MNQTAPFLSGRFLFTFFLFTSTVISIGQVVMPSRFGIIGEIQNYSIDEKRDIFNTFDSEEQIDQGLPIDPFDLMNRLKQAGAMNNATTPSDALDEALDAFDESDYGNVPIK